ncbi:hypothetical protein OS493_033734 [Desmophyllum pertusum]|uniref:VWA7 Ig-like domain-containing protein n=1 Tax=Desmophyllum pertusum TaxID=174260 RepID=A0A9X0D0Y3_9CNID|nr:hypothetical protein OS493_033734 [Desmophyllum pertusum]
MQKRVISTSNKLRIIEVTSLVSGSLELTVSCRGPYTLQVTGSSPIDFTYQLLDVEDMERGTTRRVVGNPLREIDAVSNLTLVGVDGTDLETFNITQGEGFYQNSYYVAFIPSSDTFRLKVTGLDKSGALFQRVKPTLFTLGDVKLSQNVDNSSSSNAIVPGESLELEINVKNTGDPQTLYFTASDDLKYFNSTNPSQGILGKNDTLILRVSLLAPGHAAYGVTSTVTVVVSQNSDFTQLVNFMVLFVTVASKDPDLSPPSCTVTNQTGSCAGVYGKPECVSSTWFAHAMFIDVGEGLLSITSRENRNGTLRVAAFNRGAVNTPITTSFTSNCCHPKVIFAGLDLVGNMGTCSVSLVPDILSFSAQSNTTDVSLHPGDTTKVPFTLTNLGSKGSFSFHVTKTSSLISYVVPFSLALDTNASAAGQVVIASRGETSELERLSVKAVSQSDTVNIKEVTLFVIQVSVLSKGQPTTPALKHVRLEAVVPSNDFSIKPGANVEVNFTVTNLASTETFSFHVSC